MRAPPVTHRLEKDHDEVLIKAGTENLALVDLESYPVFIGKRTDYFDMMAHLSNQMKALTVLAWKAPEQARNFRLCLAENDLVLEQTQPHRIMIASGNVRTYGQLCLTTHERLFDSARHRNHGLLHANRLPPLPEFWVLDVPPGVYSIYVFYHEHQPWQTTPQADYSVLLRHYPFPPRRVAPIRLSGFAPRAV